MVLKGNYSFYLTDKFSSWATTVAIGTVVETGAAVSLSTETSILITYEDNNSIVERVKATATWGILTTTERWLDNSKSPSADSSLEVDWRPWAICYVTTFTDDIVEKDADNTLTWFNTFQWGANWGEYASTAARDSALWGDWAATKAYSNVYITGTGNYYNYNLSSWQREVIDTGTATPNATTSVAGKQEVATNTEVRNGTTTWGSGATLTVNPTDFQKVIVSGEPVSFNSSTWSDTYTASMQAALTTYTTRMMLVWTFATANTGACTLNIDSLWAVSIKTKEGNDPEDGHIWAWSTHVLIYDGTNFVLQTPSNASTTVKGLVELATDAEVESWDAGKIPDADQVKNYYEPLVNVVSWTRSSTWSESIAHGLSRTPLAVYAYYNESNSIGNWFYADSVQYANRVQDWWQAGSTSLLIYTWSWFNAAVTAIDGTNLDVTRSWWSNTTTYRLVFVA